MLVDVVGMRFLKRETVIEYSQIGVKKTIKYYVNTFLSKNFVPRHIT